MRNLQTFNVNLLKNLHLTISYLSDRQYTETMKVLSNATIGQHVRHIIEFYEAVDKAYQNGEINYDARERSLEIETSVEKATKAIQSCQNNIQNFKQDIEIEMSGNYSIDEIEASKIPTTLSREIAYVMDHTIHHLAIIKNALILQGVKLDENFGLAPSTIRFRKEKCVQ